MRRDGRRADWLPQPRSRPWTPPAAPAAFESPPAVRPAAPPTTWWLILALVLAIALLLLPPAITPRTIRGTSAPQPPPPRSAGAQAVVRTPEPAALPDGDPVTPTGSGSWHVVPGATGRAAGTGAQRLTYTVEVEDGVDVPSFATDVDTILGDPRGWIGLGQVSFRRVDTAPDFRIRLTSPGTSRRPDLCGFTIPYDSSCHLARGHRIVISLARWIRGAHSYGGDLASYRRYAINHEVGHALGFGHAGCPRGGAPAPVMMQQTFGLSNTYLADLNRIEPGAATKIRPDGAVCRPNPWVTSAP